MRGGSSIVVTGRSTHVVSLQLLVIVISTKLLVGRQDIDMAIR